MKISPGSQGVGAYPDHGPTCPRCYSGEPGHEVDGAACRTQRADQEEQQRLADQAWGFAPRAAILPPEPALRPTKVRPCSLCLAASPVLLVPVRRCLACLIGHRPIATLVDLPERRTVAALYDAAGSLVAYDAAADEAIELAPGERAEAQRLLDAAERREGRA